MTPAIARVTWAGGDAIVDAMWNRGVGDERGLGETLRDGRLFLGCGNPRGLHLIAGRRCELHNGEPAPVEVWLGKIV